MNDGALDTGHAPRDVDVLESKEVWSEYRLADGTVLRIKPVMITVSRMEVVSVKVVEIGVEFGMAIGQAARGGSLSGSASSSGGVSLAIPSICI